MSAEASDKRPTVLQIVPALETGGAERTAVDIALRLDREGWGSIVASAGGRMVAELDAAGVRHVALPLVARDPLTILRNFGRIGALVRETGCDILHARSRAPAWSAYAAARRTGAAFVTTYHGAYGQKGRAKALYNSVMARGERVIANSHWTAGLIAERHPFARGRIVAIPRGTDFGDFDPDAIDPSRLDRLRRAWGVADHATPLIVNLARLTGWKGQAVLIEAVARLHREGAWPEAARLVLAGDAQGRHDYLASLRQAIAAAGLDDRILLPGHCDDPAAAMALADIAVVASTEPEAFGRAAVEAQAMRAALIVTRIGAVEETVLAAPEVPAEEATGLKVPPGDAAAMAQALRQLLAMSPQARTAMGERGRAHVTAAFSLPRMEEATLAVYRDVMAGRT